MTDVFSHAIAPQFSDRDLCCTGMAPSARALGVARATLLNAALYKGHGILSIAERASGVDGGTYYIFYPAVTPADGSDTTRIMIDVRLSSYGGATSPGSITVYDYSGTELDSVDFSGVWSTSTPIGNVDADGVAWTAYVDAPTTSTGSYQWLRVVVDSGLVISCVATNIPKPSSDLTVATVRGLGGGNFTAGAPLIGYDRAAVGASGSVDSLAQYLASREGDTKQTWISASRRCLFGWATPHGRYYVQPSAAGWRNFMAATFRPLVQPRNLRGGSSAVTCSICVMYRADTGAKIRFTTSAGSVEMTLTAATTVTPAAQYASGLDIAPTGDDVTIDVYVTTTAAVEIWAIAIFDADV